MVQLENLDIMFIKENGNVFIYDPLTESFLIGPSTNHSGMGDNPACATFRSPAHGNRQIVVVVSGKTVKIFDYTSASEWERSKLAPSFKRTDL